MKSFINNNNAFFVLKARQQHRVLEFFIISLLFIIKVRTIFVKSDRKLRIHEIAVYLFSYHIGRCEAFNCAHTHFFLFLHFEHH